MGPARRPSVFGIHYDHRCSNASTCELLDPTTTSLLLPIPIGSAAADGQEERVLVVPSRVSPLRILEGTILTCLSFWWGVAGASYQIEGAVKAEGRGPTIWDVMSHRVTNAIVDNFTADITDNNYYMYKQDIARIAALGVKAYSFSIAWARIMPFGRGPVNQEAIDHYNDVINTCIEYNVIPLATLYHWDMPLYLQDTYGGWLSENIVNDFVEYARVAFGAFGDRVNHWFTVNERKHGIMMEASNCGADYCSHRGLCGVSTGCRLLQERLDPRNAPAVHLRQQHLARTFAGLSAWQIHDAECID